MGGENWKNLFEGWIPGMPKQGILITTAGESIPFIDFRTSEGILLVQRDRPDSLNARKIMISYEAIAAMKMTDVEDIGNYGEMGFR